MSTDWPSPSDPDDRTAVDPFGVRAEAEPAPEQPAPPATAPVIAYVDQHAGDRRALWLHLNPPPAGRRVAPVVSVDGRQYVVFWGTLGFEVPADRPVHVSVHVAAEPLVQAASMLLLPGQKNEWTYGTDYATGLATLT